ncbi:MAG: aminotransferase class V-fold PLP-dependent enzyme [Burkholderiales bacterium]|jgi:selenocysteine lyase/cysteine desulfurase
MSDSAAFSCRKALFSIPDGEVWLNSAYMGPLPKPVEAAGHDALTRRAFPSWMRAADFFEPAERVRGLCARLVGADPEQVALVTTAAQGVAIAATNLVPRAGRNVVLLGEQFPSNVHVWRTWRARGVEVRTVVAPDAPWTREAGAPSRRQAWNDALLAAIDDRTDVVALEQAHWTDGTLFDLERVGQRCREVGAAFVIDATQTGGAMPLDVAAIRPDLLVIHAYKSMLCNYGLGFAVLGERFADAAPLEHHWMMRGGAEDFARLVDYRDDFAPGVRRHDTAVRANPVMIAMLGASCELLLEWGPARIRDYLLRIVRPSVPRLRAAGFRIADEEDRAANIFGIGLPAGLSPESVRAALAERRIHVSVRGSTLRVAPHVYNDEADLARLVDALVEVAGQPK